MSDLISVSAGVPQGTKLGPILFLVTVNDLIPPNNDYWKYVDDMSMSEVIPRNDVSNMQSDLDHISSWANDNCMKLNLIKCKELRISFLRHKPNFFQLYIDGGPIQIVESVKVLGVTLQNDLKWESHADDIIKKAAKRLYILRVLKRNGLDVDGLKTIFKTLIRSVLQYSCPVWHSSLPAYLSDPFQSYSDTPPPPPLPPPPPPPPQLFHVCFQFALTSVSTCCFSNQIKSTLFYQGSHVSSEELSFPSFSFTPITYPTAFPNA